MEAKEAQDTLVFGGVVEGAVQAGNKEETSTKGENRIGQAWLGGSLDTEEKKKKD